MIAMPPSELQLRCVVNVAVACNPLEKLSNASPERGIIGSHQGFCECKAIGRGEEFGHLIRRRCVAFRKALIWRAFCEFYVAIFRIGDDLAALRRAADADAAKTKLP